MKKSVNVHKNFVKKELNKKKSQNFFRKVTDFSEFVEKIVLFRNLVLFLSFEKPY